MVESESPDTGPQHETHTGVSEQMTAKVWHNSAEVAEMTGHSVSQINRLCREGKVLKRNFKRVGPHKQYSIRLPEALEDMKNNVSVRHRALDATYTLETPEKAQKTPEPPSRILRGPDDAVKKYGFDKLSIAEAQEEQARQKAADLKIKNDKQSGKLVDAAEVEQIMAGLVLTSRGKLLALKGLLTAQLKEFIEDPDNFQMSVKTVGQTIDDALTALSVHSPEDTTT